MRLESLDAAVVAPNAVDGRPTPFPASPRRGMRPLLPSELESGWSFLLLSNAYDTNYPLWYPFAPTGDEGAVFRFAVQM